MYHTPTTVTFRSIGRMAGKYKLPKECLMCGSKIVTYAAVIDDGFGDSDGLVCVKCLEDAKKFYKKVEHLDSRVELR